jgi:3-oxoacyl-[acyl-carrier protein] reductase
MSRVALVTGASRGIGRSIAVLLAARGHHVAVNYRTNAGAAAEVVEAIEGTGGEALAVQADVSDADQVTAMFAAVEEHLGAVEVLINNAGVTRDGLLLRMQPEAWDEVLATDLRSAYLCSRAALRAMVKARWGRIVSIGSVSGVAGNAGQANYAAAKAGLIGFSKSLAKEVGSRGITVNVVAPGFIETDLTASLAATSAERLLENISLGRFGRPEEIASVVGYLASDEAGYITGQTIVVDGGLAL